MMKFQHSRRPLLATLLAAGLLLFCFAVLPNQEDDPTFRREPPECAPGVAANLLPPMSADSATMVSDLFRYITRPSGQVCHKVASFGGQLMLTMDYEPVVDGNKFACLDPEFGLEGGQRCLVYSVGIFSDWTFEWDMEAFGCEVIALDPSLTLHSGSQNGTITFFRYGVAGKDYVEARNGWRLLTLETLLQQLEHSRRQVHYLKMDVESTEWGILQQQVELGSRSTLARNVQQIALELHLQHYLPLELNMPFYRKVYETFKGMQDMGFYLLSYEPNRSLIKDVLVPGLGEPMAASWESVWIKSRCVGKES